jgi:hypothetical protein
MNASQSLHPVIRQRRSVLFQSRVRKASPKNYLGSMSRVAYASGLRFLELTAVSCVAIILGPFIALAWIAVALDSSRSTVAHRALKVESTHTPARIAGQARCDASQWLEEMESLDRF